MIHLKRFFDFYIKSSLHVALCYVAFYIVVSLHAGFQPEFLELLAVGSATLVGYNSAKYIHQIHSDFSYRRGIIIITLFAILISVTTILKLGAAAILLFTFCSLLTSLYALPELLGRSFRQIPVLKLITIGICWSILAVGLPHLLQEPYYFKDQWWSHLRNLYWNNFILWEIVEYTLFVIALCIPFEIRDLKYDSPNLRTLPQLIGTRNSKFVGIGLVLICAVTEFTQHEESAEQGVATLVIFIITACAVWFSDRFKNDYYSSFFVESIPMVWLGIYLALLV